VPFQIRKFRLNRATAEDGLWLQRRLERESARLGAHVSLSRDGTLAVSAR
jgi:poly-gamma-glutamate synthesis protein (capsule biosynthesis protein)